MTKHPRLKRYKSAGNQFPTIPLTGVVELKYRESEHFRPMRGDVRFYLHDDASGAGRMRADYESLGVAGYLKAELYDGKEWRLMVMEDFFSDRLHHFGKRERPIDTYPLCRERMESMQGKHCQRIYREHYELAPEAD